MQAPSDRARVRAWGPLWLVFYLLLALLCWWAFQRALGPDGAGAIFRALATIDPGRVAASLGCVAGVFVAILAMEQLALRRAAPAAPAARRNLLAGFVSNAVSLGAGFGMLSGGALRARLYANDGVDVANAFYIATAVTLMSMLGGILVAALGLVFLNAPASSASIRHAVALLLLLGLAALLVLAGPTGRQLRVRGHTLELPARAELALGIALGACDWLMSAGALYVLIPADAAPHFLAFAAIFTGAQLVAMVTGSPSGLGVFDAIIVTTAGPHAGPVSAALIIYRLTAFLTPVALGLTGLSLLEARAGRHARGGHDASAKRAHFLLGPFRGAAKQNERGAPISKADLFAQAEMAAAIPLHSLTNGGPVLVLAPHPDDDVLGCGGLMAACAAAAIPVRVVYLTDGKLSHFGSRRWPAHEIADARQHEAVLGAQCVGMDPSALSFLRIPDATLLFNPQANRRALAALHALDAQLHFKCIVTSWLHDPHPDHVGAARLAQRFCAVRKDCRLLHYPIWGRFLPDGLQLRDRPWRAARLDIGAHLETKRAALAAHRTQMTPMINDALLTMRAPWREQHLFLRESEIYFEY